jgi:hypothetical protein
MTKMTKIEQLLVALIFSHPLRTLINSGRPDCYFGKLRITFQERRSKSSKAPMRQARHRQNENDENAS